MKQFLIWLIFLIPSLVNAQTEHAEFWGIPIDGKVSKFKKQLFLEINKRGITLWDKKIKTEVYGNFSKASATCYDEDEDIIKFIVIYYDTNSKIVFQVVERVIVSLHKDNQVTDLLYEKYKKHFIEEYDYGYPKDSGFVFWQLIPNKSGTKAVGTLGMFKDALGIDIFYSDKVNMRKYYSESEPFCF